MKDDYLSSMSSFGMGGNYTLEEIEKAEKMKKKNGGTLMDNLAQLTGRSFPTLSGSMDLSKAMDDSLKALQEQSRKRKDASKLTNDLNEQMLKNQEQISRELADLTKNLRDDFGIDTTSVKTDSVEQNINKIQKKLTPEEEAAKREAELQQYGGLAEELGKRVFGQDEFIKKLIIAFKRPLVMPPEESKALNAIFLTGKNDTGKHYALQELAKLLEERKLLPSAEIKTIDLGIYTDASMEKLFLQDVYSALSCNSKVILFENFENCHPSFLAHVGTLVTEGKIQLSERYVLQKGQLVNVQNSLAPETVGAFTATGKYIVFITEESIDKAAGIMGAPFINALGDVATTIALDGDAVRKIAQNELEELKKKAQERFFFKLDFAEDFLDYSVTKSEKQAGLKGVRDFYNSVLQALAQAKLEGDFEKDTNLLLHVENGKVMAQKGEEEIDLSKLLPDGYRGEIEEIKKEMDEIIGLAKVKEYIFGLEEFYKVQKRRAEEGLKTGEVSKHMIFTGNPGTGKTTIARIISKYLKAIGILSGGQLVEVSRADLVGRYVGHTAPLTNKVISTAIGGVLFIDEAYSLYRGRDDSFGLEAIDTLVKGIEDNRDNLIVILAGYSNEMDEFLTSNSGLKSRFPNVIHFPDYTGDELLQISKSIAKSKGYSIDEGAEPALCAYFNSVQAVRAADAGNGRLARNKIEEAILNQSRRLVVETDAELSVLMSQDFDLSDVLSDEK